MRLVLTLLALISAGIAFQVVVLACFNALDRGQPVRPTAAGLSRLLREWGVHVLAGLALPFCALQPGPRQQPQADRTRAPVILIPGYGMNRACFVWMAFYLRKRGWPWVWAVNNRPHSAGVPIYAQRLSDAVQRLKRETGASAVDIVGHSAGGVIAAWYIKHLGGAAHTRRLITIATPWKGTAVAVFGQRAHARDLMPGSEIIQQIQGPPVPTVALWTRTDGMLHPFSSGYSDGMRAEEIENEGHLGMLYSAAVFRRVRELLAAPELPAPERQAREES